MTSSISVPDIAIHGIATVKAETIRAPGRQGVARRAIRYAGQAADAMISAPVTWMASKAESMLSQRTNGAIVIGRSSAQELNQWSPGVRTLPCANSVACLM